MSPPQPDPANVLARRRIARRTAEPPANDRFEGEALFRQEALHRRQDVTRPRPVAIVPPSWTYVSGLLLLLFITVVAFLLFGGFARKEAAVGVLRPSAGEVVLSADRPGALMSLHVVENQVVEAGAPLYDVRTDALLLDGRPVARETLALLAGQGDLIRLQAHARTVEVAAQLAALKQRTATGEDIVVSLGRQIELAKARRAIADQRADVGRGLHDKGLIPAEELRRREDAVLSAGLQEEQLAVDLRRAQEAQLTYRADVRRLEAQAAAERYQLAMTDAQLGERRLSTAQERGYRVRAPVRGQVSGLRLAPGMRVQPGDPVLTLVPEGAPLIAELYLPSRAVGFVAPGHRARLLYDAYPYQKFGASHGVVVSVSRSAVRPPDALAPMAADEPLYAVRVRLDRQTVEAFGVRHRLRPGMVVKADLILERRNLLEWLFEPVLSSTGRIA